MPHSCWLSVIAAFIIAADLPNADETVVGIMAVIAQREREMIAQRTKDALAVARKRLAEQGRALGNPNGAAALRRAARGRLSAVTAVAMAAGKRAEDLRETIADVVGSRTPPPCGFRLVSSLPWQPPLHCPGGRTPEQTAAA